MTQKPAAGNPDGIQPVFHVQRLFLKDLSFESPNVPQLFSEEQRQEPQIQFNLDTRSRKMSEEVYEVTLNVTVKTTLGEKAMFLVEVAYGGLFVLRNIPPQHVPTILGVECPHILFPYVRQIVSQATADGGFRPLLLDPINFAAAYQQAQQQRQEKPAGTVQ